ncbi:DUF1330 domain-containing protein [Nocardioides sp. AE5]|uniref:DUF1330 domain-containing protein n=1 Tax=Nocardioides sp. AE5 TaxID=2962573 RepID=UPI00288146B7|nr:DUF1330 domain-containing protein [Nocardioides sp. AE5]MDT0201673.1 DUF1330 domain-containing protein [Nocardioides sp. AE5]
MSAYWISIYDEILDEEKMAAYAKLAGPALVEAGGTFLARSLPEAVYEDGIRERIVLIEFESVEAARAAHDSPAYQAALEALDGGVRREIRIVPGA